MLSVVIPAGEFYSEETGEFFTTKETVLRLEHSLLSISKWESEWKKPFLDRTKDKTYEESISYIKCMTLSQNVDPNVYYAISPKLMSEINDYIADTRSATTINNRGPMSADKSVVTSELVYYWMAANNIPIECQKWHFSRLYMLLQIFSIKQGKEQKMSRHDVMAQNRALNAARKKAMKTKG